MFLSVNGTVAMLGRPGAAAHLVVVLSQQIARERVRLVELSSECVGEVLVVDAAHASEQAEEVTEAPGLSGTDLIGAPAHLVRPEALALVTFADEVGQPVEQLLKPLLARHWLRLRLIAAPLPVPQTHRSSGSTPRDFNIGRQHLTGRGSFG